jgi:DNA (cytosine-5)-methyltransferase 1
MVNMQGSKSNSVAQAGGPSYTLNSMHGHDVHAIESSMAVRRLTPRECERLQGFPDDYTLVEYRKKPAADGPRYKALGNSMAVPVMRWIGERINLVAALDTPVKR